MLRIEVLAPARIRVSVDGCRTWADLEAFTGQVASIPLDRNRPLWEMWVVEGMADGAVALVTKLHHAIMDGAAGGELMTSLFDLTPDVEPVTPPSEPWEPDRPPSAPALVGRCDAIARHPPEGGRGVDQR